MPWAWSIVGVTVAVTGGLYVFIRGLQPACLTGTDDLTDLKEYLLIGQTIIVAALSLFFFAWPTIRDRLPRSQIVLMTGLCCAVGAAGVWGILNTCGCTVDNPWFGEWLVEYAQDRYAFAGMCRDIILTDETGKILTGAAK